MNIELESLVSLALREDIGFGDMTTSLTVSPTAMGKTAIAARSPLVFSGVEAAKAAFRLVDESLEARALAREGEWLAPGSVAMAIVGRAQSILMAERVALNFLGHLSGVATLTAKFVKASRLPGGGGPQILDTRKTTPGLRALEKAAVRHGGGHNHRFSLQDGILIKDNHIQAAGSISKALSLARKNGPSHLKIEVEIDSLDQLTEALEGGADIVLLDNMPAKTLKMAMEAMTDFFRPEPRRVLAEASGGVSLDNIAEIAATGVDRVSIGALTHSAPAADLGLDWS
ncbi:MAG: carboxylating nicotinate-nucleotide diphosphorylase [Deltaproteobacteria bacterium]|nr:carboxylating nicotinate-nucleotide diphosphorylase [Deltaproteobacteria bacterium]